MRRQGGFTLMELLIVMSLIGVVTASAANYIHRAYSHTRHLEIQMSTDRDFRLAMAFLRDDMRSSNLAHTQDTLVLTGPDGQSIFYLLEDRVLYREEQRPQLVGGGEARRIALLGDVHALRFDRRGRVLAVSIQVGRRVGDLLLSRDYTRSLAVTPEAR